MRRYAARRILHMIPVVFIVSVIVFAMIRLIPGDPAVNMAGSDASPETIQAIRKSLGLNKPIYVQYLSWIGQVVRGNFGSSLFSHRPVMSLILPSAKATLFLTVVAMCLALVLGIPLGMIAAVHRGKVLDRVISGFAMIAVSVPSFWLGLILILFVSVHLHWLPSAGDQTVSSVISPATALGLGQAAMLIRLVRAAFIGILEQEYIRTAHHKGLSQLRIVLRHALPNALGMIVTFTSVQLGHLLAGAVVIEVVFSWPGMGRLSVDSLIGRDLPVVQACILLFTVAVLAVNLVADLVAAAIDPRIAR